MKRTAFFAGIFIAMTVMAANVTFASYINDARQYMDKKDYNAAIISLKNHLKEHSDDAQARYLLGLAYLKSGNLKGAEKEFKIAYQHDEKNEKIKLEYAHTLFLQHNYQAAKKLLKQPFIEHDNEAERLVILGSILLTEQKIADAKDYFTQAEKIKNTISVQLGFAKIALLEKDYKKAEKIIKEILQQTEDRFDALFLKAQLANELGQYQKAEDIYNSLLEKKPGNLLLLLSRVQTKYKLKDYKGAEKDLIRILKIHKNLPQANYLMALVKYEAEDYTSAEQYGQKVLNVIPEHYPSMYIIGNADFKLGRLNQAEKFFTQILFKYPDNINVQYTLARIYLAQDKPEQALLILENIKKEVLNNNPKILLVMGNAYLMSGQEQKSQEMFNKVKNLAADDPVIIESLARTNLYLGNVDKAIKELKTLDVSNNKNAQYLLIRAYIKNKQFQDAKELISQLQKKSSDDPALYTFYGDISLNENNQKIATQSYQKALEIDNAFIPAYLGLSKVALFNQQFQKADKYLQNVLQIDDQYLNAYLGRALIAEKMGQTDRVQAILSKAMLAISGQFDKELKLNNTLAEFYIKSNQKHKLLKLGRAFVEKYPQKVEALSFQVKTLLLNGKTSEAQVILQKIVYMDPKDIKHRLQLAQLFIKNNEQSSALNMLDEVLSLNHGHQQAIGLKTSLLIKMGQFAQLKSFLNALIDSDKNNIQKIYKLAIEAQKTGKYNQAVEYYKVLMAYKANDPVILNNLAWIYSLQANPEALSLAKKAYQLKPESSAIADTYGSILLKQGKQKQALQILEKAAAASPEMKDLQYHLARAYYLNNMHSKALKILDELLKSPDTFTEKNNAVLLLNQINQRK